MERINMAGVCAVDVIFGRRVEKRKWQTLVQMDILSDTVDGSEIQPTSWYGKYV